MNNGQRQVIDCLRINDIYIFGSKSQISSRSVREVEIRQDKALNQQIGLNFGTLIGVGLCLIVPFLNEEETTVCEQTLLENCQTIHGFVVENVNEDTLPS